LLFHDQILTSPYVFQLFHIEEQDGELQEYLNPEFDGGFGGVDVNQTAHRSSDAVDTAGTPGPGHGRGARGSTQKRSRREQVSALLEDIRRSITTTVHQPPVSHGTQALQEIDNRLAWLRTEITNIKQTRRTEQAADDRDLEWEQALASEEQYDIYLSLECLFYSHRVLLLQNVLC